MNATIELVLELVGGIILLLAAGYTLALLSGYDEYYDKMLYDDDDTELTLKKTKRITKTLITGCIMHQFKIEVKWKQNF